MLTDPLLKSKVDSLWEKLWTGGLSNPLDAIEQLSFLLFLKRLDEQEAGRERSARLRGEPYISMVFPEENPAVPRTMHLRWSQWTQMTGGDALRHVKEVVFPFLKSLGAHNSSFALQMENAEFKINKPTLLLEACKAIDDMKVGQQNQDVQGDIYEYLLSKLETAGRNGQFRTPRHIIRMIVRMADPKIGERIVDPAAGTCGFLVNAFQYILEHNTDPAVLSYDDEGLPHNLIGDQLTPEQREFLLSEAVAGFDSDSGMTMLRIGSMNLMLHGISSPQFRWMDTLSKSYTEARKYDLVLANPPFKGAIDSAEVNETLPVGVRKTELLFIHLFLRLLENGGRCAVVIPDGVLFGSSRAHVELRKLLVEHNRLEGVVSMPSGVFKPYAGVSTAVLFFTKGGATERIWFYDMEHDGFSLDDKRQPTPGANDIPDILSCWQNRHDTAFGAARTTRLAALRAELEPLKAERLQQHEQLHRLTFEQVIAPEGDTATAEAKANAETTLATLDAQIHPLQREVNQLTRQFWVTKSQVVANKYDLSASRYRLVERDEVFYDKPNVTLARLLQLEAAMAAEAVALEALLV
jgi:type I restriction enzyme M protein